VSLPNFEGAKIRDTVGVKEIFKMSASMAASIPVSLKLLKDVRKEKSLVIHVHTARIPLLVGYFLHVCGGNPIVITMHEWSAVSLKFNKLYSRCCRIIAISSEISRQLQKLGVNHNRIAVIPNMVNTTQFCPINETSPLDTTEQRYGPRLLFVGRLDASKECLITAAIEAMPAIVEAVPQTELCLVGDGPRFEAISNLASEINNTIGWNAVKMLGRQSKVIPLLQQSSVVLGVGRVALEAMSCSLPTITASPNKNGLLTGSVVSKENARLLSESNFSGRNYPQTLTKAALSELIILLLKDPAYRMRLGAEGRSYVINNFDTSLVAHRTASLYLDCLKQNKN
jgi:L-malate glycosyltransferase